MTEPLKVDVNLNVPIKPDLIDDVMTTALEGGINHWVDRCIQGKAVKAGTRPCEYLAEVISRGGSLLLWAGKEKHELTLDKFVQGFTLMMTEKGAEILEMNNQDGEIADCIVQYALFGEIKYEAA